MKSTRFVVVCLLFFASGAAGLIFETLWFHQARLVLGSSVWASALVPAAFMAGLGVGNGVAIRRGERIAEPLRAYAVLELVVAVSGVLLVHGLPALASVLAPALAVARRAARALGGPRLGGVRRLLVPSTAMGLARCRSSCARSRPRRRASGASSEASMDGTPWAQSPARWSQILIFSVGSASMARRASPER